MNDTPELFANAPTGAGAVIAELLASRTATANAGNRRSFFARIETLLAQEIGSADDVDLRLGKNGSTRNAVRLSRMRLRNWKSFEKADLNLPKLRQGRPLVIVGGPNGFGKSSILEAFALGLFGRRAISDMGFLINSTSSKGGQRRSYRSLLERSLHRSDRSRREAMCSVALDFDGIDGFVSVERKWYFDDAGALIDEEEELLVRVGEDRHLLEAPAMVTPAEWYQEEIERRIMPVGLATFFVFDGEQVERWAERRLSDQVRLAMGRLLGLDEIVALSEDLKDFARDRERDLVDAGDTPLDDLEREAERIHEQLRTQTERLELAESELKSRRILRDQLLGRVAGLEAGSHANQQGYLELEHRLAAEEARERRELAGVLAERGPLALAGGVLLNKVLRELADADRDDLSVGLPRGDIETIWERFVSQGPPLKPELLRQLKDRFEAACVAPDTGAQDEMPHGHLTREIRRQVAAKTSDAIEHGRQAISRSTALLSATRQEMDEARSSARRSEQNASELLRAKSELAVIATAIDDGQSERDAADRESSHLGAALARCRAELDERVGLLRRVEPKVRAAAAARRIAGILDARMTGLARSEYERFAKAVTESFKALAHKGQIARIEVKPDGEIALFDGADRDVTDYRLSAGESQLFAMALIAAVARLVDYELPLIVDTPLGRLDTKHRQSVLAMLGERSTQTILLTQPEEISVRHMATIGSRVSAHIRIDHVVDPTSSVGVSTFVDENDDVGAAA